MTQTFASLPRVGSRSLKLRNGNAYDGVKILGQESSQMKGGIKVLEEMRALLFRTVRVAGNTLRCGW